MSIYDKEWTKIRNQAFRNLVTHDKNILHRFTNTEKQKYVRLFVVRATSLAFELQNHSSSPIIASRDANIASSFVERYYDSESNGGVLIVERPDLFDQLKIKGCKYQFPSRGAIFPRSRFNFRSRRSCRLCCRRGKRKKKKKERKRKKREEEEETGRGNETMKRSTLRKNSFFSFSFFLHCRRRSCRSISFLCRFA